MTQSSRQAEIRLTSGVCKMLYEIVSYITTHPYTAGLGIFFIVFVMNIAGMLGRKEKK